jgi:CMP-N-acetylneuraminic acid synthetase
VFNGSRVLAIIPARGGSKGIPKKNIAQVAGKPLISYTTELTQNLPWLDATVVSTDSEEIAEVATQTPGVGVVWRPEELSGDRIGDHPVLRHALLAQEKQTSERYDIVLMLQPTSPLRTINDMESCITTLHEGIEVGIKLHDAPRNLTTHVHAHHGTQRATGGDHSAQIAA